jgi:hypothetical protein
VQVLQAANTGLTSLQKLVESPSQRLQTEASNLTLADTNEEAAIRF